MRKLSLLALFATVCLVISFTVLQFAWPPVGFEAWGWVWIVSLVLGTASALGVITGAALSVRKAGWSKANGVLLFVGVAIVALARVLYGYEMRPF